MTSLSPGLTLITNYKPQILIINQTPDSILGKFGLGCFLNVSGYKYKYKYK